MGGKPKSTSSSASGSAQTWAQPYAQQGVGNVLSTYDANQGNLSALSGQANQQLANLQGQGSAIQGQLGQFGRTANQGNRFTSNVIGGQYMSGNPYVRNIMAQMGEQITGDVGSAFSSAGRYGSGAYTGVLADSLADSYSQLLYGNYNDEMNRRMAATQQATGALGQQQQAQASNNQQQMAQTAMAAELPYIGANNMANGLGALFSGGEQQSKQTGASPIWGALGAGLGAAGMAASGGAFSSDRRVKTNIVKVDTLEDGLNVYDFEYRNQPGVTFRGVMADEVKELRPQAYIPNFDGEFDGVDYGKLAA